MMQVMKEFKYGCWACLLLATLTHLVGCNSSVGNSGSTKPVTNKEEISRPNSEQLQNESKESERGIITEAEAVEIGRKHFDRPKDSGLYLDDRGEYFFVAPPIKTAVDSEKAGVLINKRSGEITKNSLQVD